MVLLILLATGTGFAQNTEPPDDSLDITIPVPKDTTASDSTVKAKESPFETQVEYSADDSLWFSLRQRKAYLYGNGRVAYDKITLTAAYIEIDFEKKEVLAHGMTDTSGRVIGQPVFEDNGSNYESDTMQYNFETKKGIITKALTQDGDGYLHVEKAKKDADDNLFVRNGRYTTCSHPEPHFYLKASKLKVIKDDKIVTGPAFLAIEDVPTPLAIPFGFFPNKRTQTSGILIPTYGNSPSLGYFLQNGGYYLGFSDYFDVALQGDIYTRGSWAANIASNYRKRYKYNGNISIQSQRFRELQNESVDYNITQNLFVRWRHTQDAKARPNTRFSANVNAGSTSTFRDNINTSANDFLSNTFNSSISYGKSFPGKPFTLNVSANHSQNTNTGRVNITFPNASFNMNRIFPLKSQNRVGKEKWYEKIGLSYSSSLRNQVSVGDSTLFTQRTLDDMRNGFQQNIPVSTNFKLFKFLTLNPSLSYREVWYLRTIDQNWNNDSAEVETDTINGFSRYGELGFNAGLTTRLYGFYNFGRNSKIQAIRHVVTPTINFSYKPDYSNPFWGGDAYKTIQVDSTGRTAPVSRFDQGLFGAPSDNESGVITFGVINNIEMKVKSDKDTVTGTKKIKLLESLNFNSGYNLAADSLNWADLNIVARTLLLEKINVLIRSTINPYAINEAGREINEFHWENNRGLGRLTNASAAIGFNLKSSRGGGNERRESKFGTEQELEEIRNNPQGYVDFNVPWSLNLSYNITYSKPAFEERITNSLTFTGDVNLTPKWKIGYRSGYDFENREFTYSSFNVYRDLHCWEFAFNIVPFGIRQSYTFDINVKAPVLQDLKLSRRRNWRDLQN